MRSGATRLALKSELRHRRGSVVVMIIVIALAGGAVLTAASAATRSASAFERFVAWSRPATLSTGGGAPEDMLDDLAAVERAPFVEHVARIGSANLEVRAPNGEQFRGFQIAVAADRGNMVARDELMRDKVLRGRRPNPNAVAETTVGFATAARLGVDVGDDLELVRIENPDAPPIRVKIVGVVARENEFPSVSGSSVRVVLLTHAFLNAHPKLFPPENDNLFAWTRAGVTEKEVTEWVGRNVRSTDVSRIDILTPAIKRTINIETAALWIMSGVLALVFLVLVGQMVFRNAAAQADDVATLGVLGMTRRQLLLLGIERGLFVGVIGSLLAVGFSIIASPATPVGLARIAEPSPGVRVDGLVLAVGVVAIIAACAAAGAVAMLRAHALTRDRVVRKSVIPLPTRPVAVFSGLAFAMRPNWRRDRSSASVTIASLCIIVAAMAAVVVTLAGLAHVQNTPRLVGATWDAVLDVNAANDGEPLSARAVEQSRESVARLPGVEDAALTGWNPLNVRGNSVNAQFFSDPSIIGPAIAAGRAPVRAGEIAMGADEMRRLGVGIGDRIDLELPSEDGAPRSRSVEIVGASVLVPPIFFDAGPGDGMAMPAETVKQLGVDPFEAAPLLMVRFDADADPVQTLRQAEAATGQSATVMSFSSRDRTVSDAFRRVSTVPRALLVVLAILGFAALVHLLWIGSRRRRLHVGVLRSMGFTRVQVVAVVVVQAVVVVAVALAIGIPLGVLAGRWAWRAFAEYLRVVPVGQVPATALVVLMAAALAGSLLAATLAGLRLASRRPATLLRTDE